MSINLSECSLWQHIYFLKKCLMFISFLRETDRQTEHERGGAEREGDTESEAGSRLRAVSAQPDAGLEPANREVVT